MDLYLDFDGVINYGFENPERSAAPDYRHATAQGYDIRWSQTVIDWINGLPDFINVIWHTTWNIHDLAIKHLTPMLGITRPVSALDYLEHAWRRTWWKLDVLREYRFDRMDPFVWIDDDLIGEGDARRWVKLHNGRVVSPPIAHGLTIREMSETSMWINDHAEKA